jgi:hypothetical protein
MQSLKDTTKKYIFCRNEILILLFILFQYQSLKQSYFFSYALRITGKVIYIAIFIICYYVTLSSSGVLEVYVTMTASNLPFILLEKPLKNCKCLREVGAN